MLLLICPPVLDAAWVTLLAKSLKKADAKTYNTVRPISSIHCLNHTFQKPPWTLNLKNIALHLIV